MDENAKSELRSRDIIDRIRMILAHPAVEWPRIAAEPATVRQVFLTYAIPLAAIGPAFTFLGSWFFGYAAFGFVAKPTSAYEPFLAACVRFGLSVGGLVLLMFAARLLAPIFGGKANRRNAAKLVAYAMTPVFVAQAFGLLPMLGMLVIPGAVYAIYLIYLGCAPEMKIPHERALGYTLVLTLAGVAITGVVIVLTGYAAATMQPDPYAVVS